MKTKLLRNQKYSQSVTNQLTELHLGNIGLNDLDEATFEAWCLGYEAGRESQRAALSSAQRQAQAAINAARYALHFRGVSDRYTRNVFRAYGLPVAEVAA